MNTTWTRFLKPEPRTFRQTMVRALVIPVMIVGLGAGFIATSAFIGDSVMGQQAPAQVQAEPTKAERLLDRKCQPYQEDTIPGHAVVTLPGQDATYVESSVGFDLWGPDEKYGTADDLPGTLHAFCR